MLILLSLSQTSFPGLNPIWTCSSTQASARPSHSFQHLWLCVTPHVASKLCVYQEPYIREGDRKSWDPRGHMIWGIFSIFRTNCAILTSYIRVNPRSVVGSRVYVVTLHDQKWWELRDSLRIFHSDDREEEPGLFYVLLCSELKCT